MAMRTITGHLAADPEVVQKGTARITRLRVIETTGEYRNGNWIVHPTPTTHFVEARRELGENVAISLHRGDAVIVRGEESTWSAGEGKNRQFGRMIDADLVGADLNEAVALIRKVAEPQRTASA